MNALFFRSRALGIMLCMACVPAWAGSSLEDLLQQTDVVRTSNPTRFYQLLEQLDKRLEDATDDQRMQIRLMRAHGFLMKGQSDAAIRELKSIEAGNSSVQLRFRAGAMLANTYAVTRQFEEGLKSLNIILPLANEVPDRDSKHHGLLAAGILYNQVGEYRLGRQYAGQVLADSPSGRSKCIASNLNAEARLGLGEPPKDSEIFAAIEGCESQKEPILAGFSRTYLAQKWHDEGKLAEAIDVLERYLPEVEKTGYPLLIGVYHSMLAGYRMEQGKASVAEHHANRAVGQSLAISSSLPLVVAYRTLYEVAELRGDLAGALVQYRNFAQADKAYLNEVKARELAYQIVRQETLQKNQQIGLLDKQNQVLQLQSKLDQKSAQNTRLIVMLLIMLVASIGYWAYKIKRVQLSLKQMAETDALTGVCNRHHFTLQAERALAQCARAGEEVSLIMFDLDHFKLVNDRYGHQTGDWVLRKVADACKNFCRRIDVLGRLGGEEFAILMYGCDLRAATRVAEDCRVRLAQIDTHETGHTFAVTASFGVTSSALSGFSLAKLLSHADKMLYRAKHMGRNRVCMFEGAPAPLHDMASNVLELPHRHEERLENVRS